MWAYLYIFNEVKCKQIQIIFGEVIGAIKGGRSTSSLGRNSWYYLHVSMLKIYWKSCNGRSTVATMENAQDDKLAANLN